MMSFWKVRFDRQQTMPGSHLTSVRNFTSQRSHDAEEHAPVVNWERDEAILRLTYGRVVSRAHACDLGKQISDLLHDSAVRVLRIDLSEVATVNSEMLSQFTRAHCLASQLGKAFHLENLNTTVQEVFNITRLDRLFGTTDAARAATYPMV